MANETTVHDILETLSQEEVGTLATVQNNRPHARYMTFYHDDQLTLYSPTSKQTVKKEDIDQNPNVHILMGYDGQGWDDTVIEIEGTASLNESHDLKQRYWHDAMSDYVQGPNDPNYAIIECQPETIRMRSGDSTKTIHLS